MRLFLGENGLNLVLLIFFRMSLTNGSELYFTLCTWNEKNERLSTRKIHKTEPPAATAA